MTDTDDLWREIRALALRVKVLEERAASAPADDRFHDKIPYRPEDVFKLIEEIHKALGLRSDEHGRLSDLHACTLDGALSLRAENTVLWAVLKTLDPFLILARRVVEDADKHGYGDEYGASPILFEEGKQPSIGEWRKLLAAFAALERA